MCWSVFEHQISELDRPARRSGPTAIAIAWLVLLLASCNTAPVPPPARISRQGDEIVVAGQYFHTGTRVVTWTDPGGYDAYQVAPPSRPREALLNRQSGAPELAALQGAVDQLVLHYDGCGLSKICFKTLRERRLNVHFLLDLDGTVYQTLDLRERALHATTSNDRSIGIEIANIGAFPPGDTAMLDKWYRPDRRGRIFVRVPAGAGDPCFRTPGFAARPARDGLIRGVVQDKALVQYDFTPEQYAALSRLTAALCTVFPRIKPDIPRDASGRLVTRQLPEAALANFHGILGHWHIQANKTDPGPAFQWEKLLTGIRQSVR